MARPGLTGHRKFRRLSRLLGSPITARGALELLWDSCYESGEDYVGTSEDIETLVGWNGEPGMLTRALVEAGVPEGHGFLEPASAVVDEKPAYRVHDLWHHAPDYVAKRRRRELERQHKVDPKPDSRTAPNGGHWPQTSACLDGDGRTPSPSPSHSPSPSKDQPGGEPFLVFPAIGPVNEWALLEAQVAEWAALFPGLDVRGECRKALAWIRAASGRRKTARGMARFLVGWLTRAVDSGRGGQRQHQRPAEPSGGTTCPHEPMCETRHDCVTRIIEDARAAKAVAS